MKQTKRPARSATKPATELPEWVTKTMPEPDYVLEMACRCGDCNTESVDLTRDEYLALKLHLAKLRGYTVPKAAA